MKKIYYYPGAMFGVIKYNKGVICAHSQDTQDAVIRRFNNSQDSLIYGKVEKLEIIERCGTSPDRIHYRPTFVAGSGDS